MRAVSSVSWTLKRASNDWRSEGVMSVWKADMFDRVRRRRIGCELLVMFASLRRE